jgi:hypothetical protein
MFDDSLARLELAEGRHELGLSDFEQLAESSRAGQDAWSLSQIQAGLAVAMRHVGRLQDSLVSYERAAQTASRINTPYVYLAADSGAQLVSGLLNGNGDASTALLQIQQRSAALDLAFISNQCVFFQAILSWHLGDREGAAEALRRCLPEQLRLGHIDFLCQEFAQSPDLAMLALTDGGLAEWRTPLLDALAHSVKSASLFIELLGGGNAALHDMTIAACRRCAPPNPHPEASRVGANGWHGAAVAGPARSPTAECRWWRSIGRTYGAGV